MGEKLRSQSWVFDLFIVSINFAPSVATEFRAKIKECFVTHDIKGNVILVPDLFTRLCPVCESDQIEDESHLRVTLNILF